MKFWLTPNAIQTGGSDGIFSIHVRKVRLILSSKIHLLVPVFLCKVEEEEETERTHFKAIVNSYARCFPLLYPSVCDSLTNSFQRWTKRINRYMIYFGFDVPWPYTKYRYKYLSLVRGTLWSCHKVRSNLPRGGTLDMNNDVDPFRTYSDLCLTMIFDIDTSVWNDWYQLRVSSCSITFIPYD